MYKNKFSPILYSFAMLITFTACGAGSPTEVSGNRALTNAHIIGDNINLGVHSSETSSHISSSNLNIVNSLVQTNGRYTSKVHLTGGSVVADGKHEVSGNSLSFSGSTLEANGNSEIVFSGGSAINEDGSSFTSEEHTVTNNSVSITNSTISSIYNNNNDTLFIVGGYAEGSNLEFSNHFVKNNSVYIANSDIDMSGDVDILGGYSPDIWAKVQNNSVTFSGRVNVFSDTRVDLAGGKGGTDIKGNTLILDKATVNLVGTAGGSHVSNFDRYVFRPSYSQILNGSSSAMLGADSIALGSDATLQIEGMIGGSNTISTGTEFILLSTQAHRLTGNFDNINDNFTLYQGVSGSYTVSAALFNNALVGEITGSKRTTRQAAVPAGAQVASTSLINEASNFVSGAGISNALAATNTANLAGKTFAGAGVLVAQALVSQDLAGHDLAGQALATQDLAGHDFESPQQNLIAQNFDMPRQHPSWKNSSWASFSAISANKSSYDAGASIDVEGFSVLSGIAKRFSMSKGNMLYGAFLEYGKADIDTHNRFDNQADIRGTGDSTYVGGGILGRFDHNSGMYADASFRVGVADTSHSSSDYQGFIGRNISYDTSSLYLSTHLALGYNLPVSEVGNVDVYGKYFWARMDGDDADIIGDAYEFGAVNSHRLRMGLRYSHAINEYFRPFIGAAYEYEIDSNVDSYVNGVTLDSPTLKGGTGVFEGGISFTPATNIPITLDLNAEVFTGVREGVMGTLQLVFDF